MHSFRHTLASRALLAGESVDEVAFLLGYRDATVTRVVYIREIADARRRHMRRSRMTAEYAGALQMASMPSCRTRDPTPTDPKPRNPPIPGTLPKPTPGLEPGTPSLRVKVTAVTAVQRR